MNRFLPILSTPLVTIGRFDHPEGVQHTDPSQEVSDCHSVTFVERGGFALHTKRRAWRLQSGMVFAAGPGQVYRCRHQERHPSDVCLTVGFEPAFAEEAVHCAGTHSKSGFHVRRQTNRLAYLKLLLDDAVRVGQPPACAGRSSSARLAPDSLASESLAGEILGAAWSEDDPPPQHVFRSSQLAWYTARVRAACDFLRSEYSQDHSLSSLGRRFGMSPFHFARIFRELAGTPPHRYLLGVRLGEAARCLREGASVTDACFASGFSHLSHFGRQFHRRFGVLPSQYPRRIRF